MKKSIHNYEDFCDAYDANNVTVSFLEGQTIEFAEKQGWKMRWWRLKKDFLFTCRLRPENFNLAYNDFAADLFFTNDDEVR